MDVGMIFAWMIYLGRWLLLCIIGIALYALAFMPVFLIIRKLFKIITGLSRKDDCEDRKKEDYSE